MVLQTEDVYLGTNEDVGDSIQMPTVFQENEQLWHLQKGQRGYRCR